MKNFFIEMAKECLFKTIVMYESTKKWDKMSDEAKNYVEAKDVYYDVADEVRKKLKFFSC